MKIDTYIMKIKKRIELSDSKYPQPGEYVKIKENIYLCITPIKYNRCFGCDIYDKEGDCLNFSEHRCCSNGIHNIIFKKYE